MRHLRQFRQSRLPIRVRLALLHVAVLALVLTALAAYLVLRLRADLTGDVDRSLSARAAQIGAAYQRDGVRGEFSEITASALTGQLGGATGAQLLTTGGQVTDTSDDPIAARPMIGTADIGAVLAHGVLRKTVRFGSAYRLLAQPVTVDGQRRVLVMATSLASTDEAVHRLLVILLTGGPLALILAGGTGWWLARAALRPVVSITDKARRIGVDQLDERVPRPAVHDEIGHLADTLNAMLDRLEAGVHAQRRLVADASHDLRTPLAVMRAELDVALAAGDLPPEAAEVLSSTAEEAHRMTRIVDNLLALASIDQGQLDLLRQPVDLRAEADAAANRFDALAHAKGLSIAVRGDSVIVDADRERLAQVLSNLVDNGIKYTISGGIQIEVWSQGADACVTVCDTGGGIQPAEQARIFDRFYRVDPVRSGSGGSGLGLAIAQEIVRAHGGQLSVESTPTAGSRFRVMLPRAPSFDPVW